MDIQVKRRSVLKGVTLQDLALYLAHYRIARRYAGRKAAAKIAMAFVRTFTFGR